LRGQSSSREEAVMGKKKKKASCGLPEPKKPERKILQTRGGKKKKKKQGTTFVSRAKLGDQRGGRNSIPNVLSTTTKAFSHLQKETKHARKGKAPNLWVGKKKRREKRTPRQGGVSKGRETNQGASWKRFLRFRGGPDRSERVPTAQGREKVAPGRLFGHRQRRKGVKEKNCHRGFSLTLVGRRTLTASGGVAGVKKPASSKKRASREGEKKTSSLLGGNGGKKNATGGTG